MTLPRLSLLALLLPLPWAGCIIDDGAFTGKRLLIDDPDVDLDDYRIKDYGPAPGYIPLRSPFEAARVEVSRLVDVNIHGSVEELFYLERAHISWDGSQTFQVRVNPRLEYHLYVSDYEREIELAQVELRLEDHALTARFVFAAVANGFVRDIFVQSWVDDLEVGGQYNAFTIEARSDGNFNPPSTSTNPPTTTTCYPRPTTVAYGTTTTAATRTTTTTPATVSPAPYHGGPPCYTVSPTSTTPTCYNNHDGYYNCHTTTHHMDCYSNSTFRPCPSTTTPSPTPSPTPECGAHRWGDCGECPWKDGCTIPAYDNESDIQFRINATYAYKADMRVDVENVGNVTYRYNTAYAACYLEYYTAAGRRFLIPPGTHCDIWMTDTLEPGERATLFTWRLQECTDDQWGCAAERYLDPGTYHIRGNFTRADGSATTRTGVAFKIAEVSTQG